MINRIGNKRKIADKIIPLFPKHKTYIELFFGGGGMFFKKPKAKYNVVNDIDDDVFNLFMVIKERKEELINYMKAVPLHESLMKHWATNKEIEPVEKAIRFLFLNTHVLFGRCEGKGSFRLIPESNIWNNLIEKISFINDFCFNVLFMKKDFRKVLSSIKSPNNNEKHDIFIYADPPYLNTVIKTGYKLKWSEQDTVDLFDILINSGIRFAISEFYNPFVIELAKQHNLEVHKIAEVYSMNRTKRTEILITNYDVIEPQIKLFE